MGAAAPTAPTLTRALDNMLIHWNQWGAGNDILKPSSFRGIKGIVYLTTAQIVGDTVKKQMHY